MSYPLTTVVEKLLRRKYPESSSVGVANGNVAEEQTSATKQFVVFSYLRDFEFLWGLHRDGGLKETVEKVIATNVSELTLIVVWDGMPQGDDSPMNIGGYVTPYDWAVMFSFWLFKSATKSQKKPHVRIFILDLKSQEYSTDFGIKTLNVLHSQFPWIQIYRPVGREALMIAAVDVAEAHVRAALPVGCLGFDNFVSDMQDLSRTLSTFHDDDDVKRLDYLETAIQLWTTNLIKPGDRHTVANLIGPLILANGFSIKKQRDRIIKAITKGSPIRNALAQLAYATGLASPVTGQKNGRVEIEILQVEKPGKLGRRNNLKFILIDDQYASGFHHILASLIFGSDYNPDRAPPDADTWACGLPNCDGIKCYNQATALLEILIESPAITDWDIPRKLILPDNGDILLLDLRLWLEDSQKKVFLNTLRATCDQLDVKNGLCEKDASFKTAYGAAFANGAQNETAALVLLPLLLSHYDPSLPIVLFSSTHQRAVIEMVAHRPNIITDFSKPLLGNQLQITEAENLLENLRGALEKAIKLHEARIIWERIEKLDTKAPEFYIAGEKDGVKNTIKSTYNRLGVDAIDYPLSPEEVRKQLGYYFQHYILRAAYYDFVSIPWEFIEGGLTKGLDKAKVKINSRDRLDVTWLDGDTLIGYPKNGGALLLKQLRHKKAHGDLTDLLGSLHSNIEYWRFFSILEFLVFIDFLEQADDAVVSPCHARKTLSRAMSARIPASGNLLPYSIDVICPIWGEIPSQSFSEATKNIVNALKISLRI